MSSFSTRLAKLDPAQLAAELAAARYPQPAPPASSAASSTTEQPILPAYDRPDLAPSVSKTATKSGDGQEHSRPARLEVEDEHDEPVRRPAVTSPMRPGWQRPAITAQVLPLRPQQFHDIRFLLRNDVLLFQPFSTDTRHPVASGAADHAAAAGRLAVASLWALASVRWLLIVGL